MNASAHKSKTATFTSRHKKFRRKARTDESARAHPAQPKPKRREPIRPWPSDPESAYSGGSASLYDESEIRYDPDEPIADLTHREEDDEDDSYVLFLHFFKDSLPPWSGKHLS